MRSIAQPTTLKISAYGNTFEQDAEILASDSRYEVRLANGPKEVAEALRLRHKVFNVELKGISSNNSKLEYDEFDLRCRHLVVIERSTNRTIGTYRVNEIAPGEDLSRLYSFGEFTIEDLPVEVWQHGIEIGRACIAKDHRGTKALLLLWKALARYLSNKAKRFCFGCCSIFTRDQAVGTQAYQQLLASGFVHDSIKLMPRQNGIAPNVATANEKTVLLPPLFESYLRLGAKVCSTPMLDEAFGTIDFFVVFDTEKMNERYRRLFLS